jgi:hypothetical protein
MTVPRPLLLAAAGGLLAAAVALAVPRIRARRSSREAEYLTWQCDCGQRFRVAGIGRHRVHWLEDAPESDPVLGSTCPSCDRPLPVH